MDKFLTRTASSPNLSKRPRDDYTEPWQIPKRPAIQKGTTNSPKLPTSNRFSGLPSEKEDLMSEPLRKAIAPRKKAGQIPPIVISIQENWTHQTIQDLIAKFDKNFHLQYKGNNKVAVHCYNAECHRLVKEGLLQAKVAFHTFSRKDEKSYKVVIKGLPTYMEETLPQELAEIGFEGTNVRKLQSASKNASSCPPFLAELPAGSDIGKFRQIKYLGNCAVEIKRFKNNTSHGTQCYRCQGFGHVSRNCNLPARCVKCCEPHSSRECTKKEKVDPVHCCNCLNEHAASYRQCPERQKYLELLKKRRNVTSSKPLIISKKPPATDDPKAWPSLRKVVPNTDDLRDPAPVPSQPEQSQTYATDNSTMEMLEILTVIKGIKKEFTNCSSMLDKVFLVLKHLGQYV